MGLAEVITAVVTPFDEQGQIDPDRFERLIEHVITQGSDQIIVAGTTGESPTLSVSEKEFLFQLAVDIVKDRIPVIASTGTYNTNDSITLTKRATDIGVDGIMTVTPYYNRPSQQGLYAHFEALAQATHVPMMVYHIPGRTSVHLDIETIVRLSRLKNIRSLKDATGNIEETTHVLSKVDPSFKIYSGDDVMTLPHLAIGGSGVVSVASHVVGTEMKNMVDAYANGDIQQARHMHQYLAPLMKGLFATTSPTLIKEMLNQMHMPVGSVRLPLVEANREEKKAVKVLIQQYNIGLS